MRAQDVTSIGGVPDDLAPLFTSAGHLCPAISPALLAAQAKQESGFNRNATSRVGAQGLVQFMPRTWAKYGHGSPFDPAEAIKAQARYDCQLAKDVRRFGGDTQALALAAYNAGGSAVAKYRAVPPYRETRAYVASILAMVR